MIVFARAPEIVRQPPVPGTPVTFLWQGERWLGITIKTEDDPARLLALTSAGSKELRPTVLAAPAAKQIRICNEALTIRLGHEKSPIFWPPMVASNLASLVIDGQDAPWVRAEDELAVWWVNLESGWPHPGGLAALDKNSKGCFDKWSLWRAVADDEELVAKQG